MDVGGFFGFAMVSPFSIRNCPRQDAKMPKSAKSTKPARRPAESRTPEQQADAAALHAVMMEAIGDDLAALSALLATKTDATFFGATEFQVRDLVHALGAKAIQAAVDAKKKRATTAVPDPAPPAANRPSSNAGSAAGS